MYQRLWNEGWEYWETENEGVPARVPEHTKKLVLPHDAMLEKTANAESKNGLNTGYHDGAVSHYRKRFLADEKKAERTLMLKFEGIYMNSFIYVNDQLAAHWPYGYTTFYVSLNDYIEWGRENEIHVIVKNSGASSSRWYSGGGIYRDVYLIEGGDIFLLPDQLKIDTEELDKDYAKVRVRYSLKNKRFKAADIRANIHIYNEKGDVVAETGQLFRIRADSELCMGDSLLIPEPEIWSDETPVLYTCKITLNEGKVELDSAKDAFGIRSLSLDAKRGLRVNGKSVKLRGTCLHHDSGLLGAATYEDAHVRQLTILKQAGFNAVRMSHHPMAPAMLRACDKVGMYVMDETFDMWTQGKTDFDYSNFFNEWWDKDIEAMVRKDYNHPCVILYSIGNEIPECGTDKGIELGHRMANLVKSLDHTRYVLEAVNGILTVSSAEVDQIVLEIAHDLGKNEAAGDINVFMSVMGEHMHEIVNHPLITEKLERIAADMDLIGYNYMSSRYENDKKNYPNRVVVGSETYPPEIVKDWDMILDCPNVIGEFTWTGWDYIGETGIGIVTYDPRIEREGSLFPNQLSGLGDIDITGIRKPMSYLREVVYDHKKGPYIAIRSLEHYGESEIKTPWALGDLSFRWNWKGYEGKPAVIEVYSAAQEVELFVNGKSAGRKAAGKDTGYRTVFEITYTPGELRTDAYENGVITGSCTLFSASDQRRICIQPEEEDGNQLIYLPIKVTDEKGVLAADEFGDIEIKIQGEAELAGFGSGEYAPKYNYTENRARLNYGQALAILRKTGNGRIMVTVESDQYEKCEIRL